MNICVIIPAAGSSARYNADALEARSKLDEDLAGRPVLQRTVELFHTRPEVGAILVAGPHDDDAFEAFRFRHADKLAILGVTLVRGGATHRWETVKAALEHVPDDATHVAVHDGARPGTPEPVLDRVFASAERHPAVVPAIAIADTVKRVEPFEREKAADPLAAILGEDGGSTETSLRVSGTIDRTNLRAIQTPQVFERGLLERAYAQDDLSSTDDAGLVERLGEEVLVVEGDLRSMKITTPNDLHLLRLMLNLKGPKERSMHHKF
ncbi:MAG: 2-C-methyl-D-erythritol 4-phosphate cytidylyltransferase [Phycisphaerales bacterium JB040]